MVGVAFRMSVKKRESLFSMLVFGEMQWTPASLSHSGIHLDI